MLTDFNPYSTIKPLVGGFKVPWITDEQELLRQAAYAIYEQIYWTVPQAFNVVQRGKDTDPIYLPSGRIIVETMHQYLAAGMHMTTDPLIGTDSDKAAAQAIWDAFARRERVYSKFNSAKRFGIMRGDWVFVLRGDPDRAPGAKVSFEAIDPGSVFKIYATDENGVEDFDTVVGYHIAEQAQFPEIKKDAWFIKRTTLRKEAGGPGPVTYSVMVFELDDWGGPGMDPDADEVLTIIPETVLPAPIDQPPVYHIPHFDEPGNPWGSSEMRGVESLIAHLSQGISDEELELVLTGLGCYATNAGSPVEEDGITPRPWDIGPGKVVEMPMGPGYFFNRVTGTTTVEPFQVHLKFLQDQVDGATGANPAARGRVEAQAAESGIAIMLEMAPFFSRVGEKEQVVTDVMANLAFDWAKWIVAYEGAQFAGPFGKPLNAEGAPAVALVPHYGPKLPQNDSKRIAELTSLVQAKALPVSVLWDEMRKGPYPDLPPNETLLAALEEQATMAAEAEAVALGNRINGELQDAEDELAGQE